MTILRSGTTKAYSENFDLAFGGKKKHAAGTKKTAKTKKAATKKTATSAKAKKKPAPATKSKAKKKSR